MALDNKLVDPDVQQQLMSNVVSKIEVEPLQDNYREICDASDVLSHVREMAGATPDNGQNGNKV